MHVQCPIIPEMALSVWLVVVSLMVALDEEQSISDKASVMAADRLEPSPEPRVSGRHELKDDANRWKTE